MSAVLASIKPKYCELIASGKKTVELRKTRPKIDVPFKVYIYQTKGKWIYKILERLGLYQGKVIGEFVCDRIDKFTYGEGRHTSVIGNSSSVALCINGCITPDALLKYANNGDIYAWHISELKIYDEPKELSEFMPFGSKCIFGLTGLDRCIISDGGRCTFCCIRRPPQSWCYVEEMQ